MSSPSVSIVMPTYDAAQFLDQALDSILYQSFEDYELVIVDDGSTDGTVECVRRRDDDRIRLIQREDESGITSALNRGIEEARGDYIARHDADDWSHPERLQRQVEYLQKNPDVVMVGTGANLVDEDGNYISRRRVLESPTLRDIIDHNEFIHGSVLIRHAPLKQLNGYNELYESAEDYDLWLRMADEYTVRNIDEPLYNFRLHSESIYAENLELLNLYHILAIRQNVSGLDRDIEHRVQNQGVEVIRDEMTQNEKKIFYTTLAQEFIRYHRFSRGRSYAKHSLTIEPLSISVMGLLILSFTSPMVVDFVIKYYRLLINFRVALANKQLSEHDYLI